MGLAWLLDRAPLFSIAAPSLSAWRMNAAKKSQRSPGSDAMRPSICARPRCWVMPGDLSHVCIDCASVIVEGGTVPVAIPPSLASMGVPEAEEDEADEDKDAKVDVFAALGK